MRGEAGLKQAVLGIASLLALTLTAAAEAPDPTKWDAVLAEAKGETVYFNAWGGAENINAYLDWAGDELAKRYGVKLVHVKLDDTANAVAKVVAEKAAGKDDGGTVDLIWINGENFASMKQQGLLYTPGWAESLPNWRYVDIENKPTIRTDFTIPVDGLESPWGMGKLVFFHDSARTDPATMPTSARDLLAWARKNPGRFSYPQPPDFIGSSFLKQVLIEFVDDRALLSQPVDEANFEEVTAPLFAWLDEINPLLWRGGKSFPQNYSGHEAAACRQRGRHHLRLQSVRGLERHRGRRTARYGALLHLPGRHAGQHAFRCDPLQCQCQGRRPGARQFPASRRKPRRTSRTRMSGATRPCWPCRNLTRKTRPASTRSISASPP